MRTSVYAVQGEWLVSSDMPPLQSTLLFSPLRRLTGTFAHLRRLLSFTSFRAHAPHIRRKVAPPEGVPSETSATLIASRQAARYTFSSHHPSIAFFADGLALFF